MKKRYVKLFEQYNGEYPEGITFEETLKIAQTVADIVAAEEFKDVKVNMRTIEEASFDLDMDGEEFDGGSYNIYDNGDVVNVALPDKPIVYNYKNIK